MIPEKRIIHLKKLLQQLEVEVADFEPISRALTHPSFILENEGKEGVETVNNQRLEFLGDAVVDLLVGEYLFHQFPQHPEGILTKMRAALVCEATLASAARRYNLGEYLLVGKGEKLCGGNERTSNLADAWEALMAAIYLELGLDEVRRIMIKAIAPEIDRVKKGHFGDYKTQLQEFAQQTPNAKIEYKIISEDGPDHAKNFTARVVVNEVTQADGVGKTKKEAEQNAACQALIKLGQIEQ